MRWARPGRRPDAEQAVDAIAGMTDRYALAAWKAAFAPEAV